MSQRMDPAAFSRRSLLRAGGAAALGLAGARLLGGAVPAVEARRRAQVGPDDALRRLMEGNQRFVDEILANPNQGAARRVQVSAKQEPFATILGCADSRVPPEVIFDQGLGDLFVVRVAGN